MSPCGLAGGAFAPDIQANMVKTRALTSAELVMFKREVQKLKLSRSAAWQNETSFALAVCLQMAAREDRIHRHHQPEHLGTGWRGACASKRCDGQLRLLQSLVGLSCTGPVCSSVAIRAVVRAWALQPTLQAPYLADTAPTICSSFSIACMESSNQVFTRT